jgi:4-hydroxy-tetrahydrodipicolinate synthase
MTVTAQVTENSAPQILENIELVKMAGADIAVMAPPFFLFNATPANILKLYRDVIRQSVLPIGIYDRGLSGAVVVPDDVLAEIYREPRVVLIKDSSNNTGRREIALAAKARRPALSLLTGYEFDCVSYLQSGYDGALLGGGVFNAHIANLIYAAMRDGNLPAAKRLQARMNRLMWEVYGGKKITCWLAGEKYLLTRMGIFRTWRNHLNYEVTPACRRAIGRALIRDRDLLLPGRTRGHE